MDDATVEKLTEGLIVPHVKQLKDSEAQLMALK